MFRSVPDNIEIGANDLYVIKKLRESEITLNRIDQYLQRVYHSVKDAPIPSSSVVAPSDLP